MKYDSVVHKTSMFDIKHDFSWFKDLKFDCKEVVCAIISQSSNACQHIHTLSVCEAASYTYLRIDLNL